MRIAEKAFKVTGQRSRSRSDGHWKSCELDSCLTDEGVWTQTYKQILTRITPRNGLSCKITGSKVKIAETFADESLPIDGSQLKTILLFLHYRNSRRSVLGNDRSVDHSAFAIRLHAPVTATINSLKYDRNQWITPSNVMTATATNDDLTFPTSIQLELPRSCVFLPGCIECIGRSSEEKAVCPSVCQTRVLWQNERKICQIFISSERSFRLVFWEEEWLVGGDLFYLKFWVKRPQMERNRRFWTDIRQRLSRNT